MTSWLRKLYVTVFGGDDTGPSIAKSDEEKNCEPEAECHSEIFHDCESLEPLEKKPKIRNDVFKIEEVDTSNSDSDQHEMVNSCKPMAERISEPIQDTMSLAPMEEEPQVQTKHLLSLPGNEMEEVAETSTVTPNRMEDSMSGPPRKVCRFLIILPEWAQMS
ncbi:uncharacterized protein LOC124163836 [Ischnura elegans]|uniref:uncharacterized protein LOC124163836 n=1 Tax=Ischnura elegans TaxID=197161 RepID=UPI001ED8B269|nr:uncharacterized protein LOC124163836 [Ischnura elegans]